MKIVYVASLWPGSTCCMRLAALKQLGHVVVPLSSDLWRQKPGLVARARSLFKVPEDGIHINQALRTGARSESPDLVWIDKGLMIWPSTLREIRRQAPRAILVSFHPDDVGRRRAISLQYRLAIPEYDYHVTTRRCNVQDLKRKGAQHVILTKFGFDPHVHRPLQPSESEQQRLGAPIGFIGYFEPVRAEILNAGARAGMRTRVWGWGPWEKAKRSRNLKVECQALWGERYAKAISSFAINVGFLSTYNRDEHTTRTFEIPACGGFLLAQRTSEHTELYREGIEAEFFGDAAEFVDKAAFYLKHPEIRNRVRLAGHARCLSSGYDYASRLSRVLNQITSPAGSAR